MGTFAKCLRLAPARRTKGCATSLTRRNGHKLCRAVESGKARRLDAVLQNLCEVPGARMAVSLLMSLLRWMTKRVLGSSFCPPRLTIIVTLALAVVKTPSSARAAAPTCTNESLRKESRENASTHQPYSAGLPECRAFEMVSPLDKGGTDISTGAPERIPVAANGEAVGFYSQNAFGDAENYSFGPQGVAENPYVARRETTGWVTTSALAPLALIPDPSRAGLSGDFTSDDLSVKSSCGIVSVANLGTGTTAICAVQRGGTEWVATQGFPNTNGASYEPNIGDPIDYIGSSADLSHEFFESDGGAGAGGAFLSSDTSGSDEGDGIYEVSGTGGAGELHLVNVDANGNEIGPDEGTRLGGITNTEAGQPIPCLHLGNEPYDTSAYHAISEDGTTVYFTACPSNVEGGINTIYARIAGRETVAISTPVPSQCTTCSQAPASAAFEGASADGAKAFFLTTQQLVNGDTDTTEDLYEYDRDNPQGKNIVQVSRGGIGDLTPGVGANVQGVVRTSSDGSHIYFVATGVLTSIPNAQSQVAQLGADNLYAADTETDETKFVAELCSNATESGSVNDPQCPPTLNSIMYEEGATNDAALWGVDNERLAQATPDGQYLVFDTYARVIDSGPESDEDDALDVYRYDFVTGQIARVSIGEPSFPASHNGNGLGMNATIAAPMVGGLGPAVGALASVNDWGRAISSDGSTIIFATPEPLQADDTDTGSKPSCDTEAEATGCDVYVWHYSEKATSENQGDVAMLSPGNDTTSADTDYGAAGMSESGADIFVLTRTALVGQDTDKLTDLYDARVDGGFPAPKEPPQCEAEGQESTCQGAGSEPPAPMKPEGSSTQLAGDNLTPPPFMEVAEPQPAGVVKITKHTSNTLFVKAPGKGIVSLSGAGLKSLKLSVQKAGTYNLKLTLTAHEQALLRERKHVTVDVSVRFVPTNGKASSAKATVTVKSSSGRT